MKILSRGEAACENLYKTYYELGAATPGAKIWREDGFTCCTGPFEHPICNFAADLNLDIASASRLREVAHSHPSLSVYAVDGEESNRDGAYLADAGFRLSYQLTQMVADPARLATEVQLEEAIDPVERQTTSRFMVEQFFRRQAPVFRKRVADATAAAEDLRLFRSFSEGELVAAVMLCETEQMLGIYNLCVSQNFRNQGIGKKLVRTVLAMAKSQNRLATLQCDLNLVPWYRDEGFRIVGSVDVYSLPQFHMVDIMG